MQSHIDINTEGCDPCNDMPIIRPDFIPGGVYHIYNRGAAKLKTFIDPQDYQDFEDVLRYLIVGFPVSLSCTPNGSLAKKKFKDSPHIPVSYSADPRSNGLFGKLLKLVAYCLMPNHYHLLVQLDHPEGEFKDANGRMRSFQTISEFMRRLCITYCQKFNYKHDRQGVLFQGRYKIKIVPDDAYAVQVNRYIHINPVDAGLVKAPEDWRWSDYHTYWSGKGDPKDQFTDPNLTLSFFGNDKLEYKKFVNQGIGIDEASKIFPYTIDQEK